MLERTESGVALARIGGFARTAHVKDEARVGQVVGDVDDALQFVHGLDAPDALDLADGKRGTAFAHGAHVAACRPMQREKLQAMLLERGSHGLNFQFTRIFEMAAGAENLEASKPGLGDLSEQLGRQLSRYK